MQADPHIIELVQQLRERLGMFAGAMAISPEEAWEQALRRVDFLRRIAEGTE